MTTKQQRTAYNLTKLVQHVNPEDHGCALYEIAEDAGLAMVHLGTFDLDGTFVFVPQKEWDKAIEECRRRERVGSIDPEFPHAILAKRWRDAAMAHEF
ncbi:MAG: hypothetical protein IJ586_08580 [Alloprevotella sp.]|nr:hypothetical protein [Alloprevotella sp.]MBR1447117.1 hypothetical protein [Alloprevotella sp.]